MEIIIKKHAYEVKEELQTCQYLVTKDGKDYVAFDYKDYPENFADLKFAAKRLKNSGIKTPQVYEVDKKNKTILMEYISGPTCFDDLVDHDLEEKVIEQLFNMNYKARINGMRLDFDPTCFIFKDGELYYMPFAFSPYNRAEDFTQKELRLWYYTNEFKELLISKGIKIDQSRLKNEYERNKELVLVVVKYFK